MTRVHIQTSTRFSVKHQRGLTLVELMIALAINLVLVGGLLLLLSDQARTRDDMQKGTRAMESGRHAARILGDSIQHAGYYGEWFNVPVPTAIPDPCSVTVANLRTSLALPMQGYTGGTSSPLPVCIPSANYVQNTHVLVVRRVLPESVTLTDAATLPLGRVYVQTNAESAVVDTGSNANATTFNLKFKRSGSGTPELRRLLVQVYYVSPCRRRAGTSCSSTDDGGRPTPTLWRLELDANGATTILRDAPVAEGVQDMRLRFGLDADADGFPDSYGFPASTAEWASAVAVDVNLLVRNPEPTAGYQDTKKYDLNTGTLLGPFSDGYPRHVYRTTVRAVNLGGRRAVQ